MQQSIYLLVNDANKEAIHALLAALPTDTDRATIVNAADPDNESWTPLNIAAAAGNIEMVELLIGYGANPNHITDLGPLHHAVMSGNPVLVAYFLALGSALPKSNQVDADPQQAVLPPKLNVPNTDIALLEGLPIKSPSDAVRVSIDAKTNDDESLTSLHLALQQLPVPGQEGLTPDTSEEYKTRITIVKLLIEAGADVNAASGEGRTSIFVAAQNGDATATQLLLAQPSIDPCPRDKHGRTPIHIAASGGHSHIINQIVTFIAEQPQGSPTFERTSLCFLRRIEAPSPLELSRIALESGDTIGWRAIHFAARNGHTETLRYLVELAGCDSNAQTAQQWTALHFAVSEGHLDASHFLIRNSYTPLVSTNALPETPNAAIIKIVSTNIFLQNESDATALHFAALRSLQSILVALVEAASQQVLKLHHLTSSHPDFPKTLSDFVNIQDIVGYTALHLAAIKGDAEAVAYLLSITEPVAQNGNSTVAVPVVEPPKAVVPNIKDFRGRTPAEIVEGILEADYGVVGSGEASDEVGQTATEEEPPATQELINLSPSINESRAHVEAKEVQMARLKAVLLLLKQA